MTKNKIYGGNTMSTVELKKEIANEVIGAMSSCAEFKAAAENYLKAVGTDGETEAAEALIAEAKDDINDIEGTISFFGSETAQGMFGAVKAAEILNHMKEVKANGGRYCDCPGCKAALRVIENSDLLLSR